MLLAFRSFVHHSPTCWYDDLRRIGIGHGNVAEPRDPAYLVLRRKLAATLLTPKLARDTSPAPCLVPPAPPNTDQLRIGLRLLERSLSFCHGMRNALPPTMPPGPAWQSIWSEAQVCYTSRNEDMQAIMEVETTAGHETCSSADGGFPSIIFSSAKAIVLNIVLHLDSMILLQDKPRSVRAVAEVSPSTSPLWHLRRISGIAVTASDFALGDPLA